MSKDYVKPEYSENLNNAIKSFGVIVHNFNISQRDYTINLELNKLTKKYYDLCPVLFFGEYAKLAYKPSFGRLPLKEVCCYKHPVIATDIKSALLLKECICPPRKILYVWDLEWLYRTDYSFDIYSKIYHSFEIIVRSESHYNLFTKVWRKPNYLIEDFNHDKIRNVVLG